MAHLHHHFNSLAEFTEQAQDLTYNPEFIAFKGYDRSFYGNDSWNDVIAKALGDGETTHVEEAKRLASQLESSFPSVHQQWLPDVVGAYPVVPDVLAGFPENMRSRHAVTAEFAPLKIWVPINSAVAISSATIEKRGTALLALALALIASGRPVELCAMVFRRMAQSEDTLTVTIAINTTPMSLSEACFMLCNPAFCRRLMYAVAYNLGGSKVGRQPEAYHKDAEKFIAEMTQRLGVDFIAPRPNWNEENIIKRDPIAWLNSKIKTLRAKLEGEG